MSSELRKTIDGKENQIPDLSREPVTFSEEVNKAAGSQNVTWLSNLAVIQPTETQRAALRDG